jgi:hypothetical protein
VEQKSINRMERVFWLRSFFTVVHFYENRRMKICTHEENREKASERKIRSFFLLSLCLCFILVHRINKLLFGCDAKKEFSRFNYAKRNSFETQREAEQKNFFTSMEIY